MATVRFSRRAEADLFGITTYSLHTWGQDQTIDYLNDLEYCCQMLAENPGLGRSCPHVLPGLRRIERGRHVVFYRQEAWGIMISRILHERMLPVASAFENEDPEH